MMRTLREKVAVDPTDATTPRLVQIASGAGWLSASLLLGIALWQLALAWQVLPAGTFPGVVEILGRLAGMMGEGSRLGTAVLDTLLSTGAGFLIAAGIGIPVGLVLGLNERLYRLVRFVIDFLRPIPPIAVLPAAVLILGTSMEMKLVIVVFGALFPILIQTIDGVRVIHPVAVHTAEVFHIGRVRRFVMIELPAALPYIATGLRLAAVYAILVSVSVEILVGSPGLGARIVEAQYAGAMADMLALVIVAGLLGLLINAILGALQRIVVTWAPSAT